MAKAKRTTNSDPSKLDELACSIKAEHEAVVQSIRTSLDHARKAGELLSEAREAVKSSVFMWGKWVEMQCGIKERTANNYIRICEKWSEIEAKLAQQGGELHRLTVRGALDLLNTRRSRTQREPLTLATLKDRMTQHHIQGDPSELLALLKELGLRVPMAEGEGEGEDDLEDDATEE